MLFLIKIILLFFLLLFQSFCFSQNRSQDDLQKQFEQQKKMLEKMFSQDRFEDFDKQMEEMLKQFQGPGLGPDIFKRLEDILRGRGFGRAFFGVENQNYEWIIVDGRCDFVLKMTPVKDAPLEIDVKNGQLTVKGKFEKVEEKSSRFGTRRSHQSFFMNHSLSIPKNCDAQMPQVLNEKDKIIVRFPRVGPKGAPSKRVGPHKRKGKRPQENTGKQPLRPEEGDITL